MAVKGKKNDWARLHIVALEPSERAPQVPEDTKKVPLEMWVKGRLEEDAEVGSQASVITRTGRRVTGTLEELNPCYTHSFGEWVPELLEVGETVKNIVFGGDK